MLPMSRLFLSYIVIGFLLAGCNLNRPAPPANGTVHLASAAASPSATHADEPRGIPTQRPETASTETPVQTPGPYVCGADDGSLSARRISALVDVDYAAKTAAVDERILFANRETAALESVILDVQANQWRGSFWLETLLVNHKPAEYELDLNRLEIPLETPLPPGCQLEIQLDFRLEAAEIRAGLRAYRGFFGYSPRQFNMAHFLPTVAARVNGDWRIHQPIGIGEQIVYELADWDVTVKVENAADSLQLAAPGKITEMAPRQWRAELPRSRDFAISMSENFLIAEREIPGDVTIVVYTFPDAVGAGVDGASHTMQETVKAMTLFQQLFGDYPYDRFAVVQGDFPDGIEFTGLVFVGTAWFYHFDGTHYNYLTLISVHEAAHQWWYARVGSDSALHPWLDEALATYSEYLFIEAYYPADKNWWWTFRVADFSPQGDVDSAVYEFSDIRDYINAVYLRGVQMMHNLREDIGDAAFFELLREYGRAGAGRIAEPSLFWAQFTDEQLRLSRQTREDFLRYPNAAESP